MSFTVYLIIAFALLSILFLALTSDGETVSLFHGVFFIVLCLIWPITIPLIMILFALDVYKDNIKQKLHFMKYKSDKDAIKDATLEQLELLMHACKIKAYHLEDESYELVKRRIADFRFEKDVLGK